MKEKIEHILKTALKDLGIEEVNSRPDEHPFGRVTVEHPEDLKNGDYSTNVALVTAKKIKTNPISLAKKIKEKLEENMPEKIEKIEVAGAGFINFFLSQKFFSESIEKILNTKNFEANNHFAGKEIMIEYTDPNPFKPFHIGHLMTNAIGESISRILEAAGANVYRVNYQGDVGLHVAKALYSLLKEPSKYILSEESLEDQARAIGEAYAAGAKAYEEDSKAKEAIDEINKKVYERTDQEVNKIYDWGFKVTMEAFENIYKILGTKFYFYFLESQVAPIGESIVKHHLGQNLPAGRQVFEESDDAIVFKAEKHDSKLHTRVFITSKGIPAYEAKDLGLAEEKFKMKPNLNLSIVVTANEQKEYMKVVMKAVSLINPEHERRMKHITHGMLRFASGKMSSREGNVVTGESLIDEVKGRARGNMEVAVGAIKYAILHQAIGADVIFDLEKSISVEGDSGPYLQYSYARANSVIAKAKAENILPDFEVLPTEVSLVEKLLYRFQEVVLRAGKEYEPHYIANYLIELARAYNNFYANNMIVGKDDQTSSYKVALTFAFSFVMKRGLYLLGIEAPERM
jgi:arginyl-tRNA synthetase